MDLFREFRKLAVLCYRWMLSEIAHIAQQVEHFLGKEEVIGSNPIVSTRFGECEGLGRYMRKRGRETCIL